MPYRPRFVPTKKFDVKKRPAPTADKIAKIRELLRLKG